MRSLFKFLLSLTPAFMLVPLLVFSPFPGTRLVHATTAPTAPVESLTFDRALRLALERDPLIAAENATLAAVRAEGVSTRLFLLPDLRAQGSFLRQDGRSMEERGALAATWNLFRFGADVELLTSQKARESGARAAARAQALTQEAIIVEALLRLTASQREIEMLNELSRMENENLMVVRQQYRLGRVPIQDVQKIEIDLENVAARISDAERRRTRARNEGVRFIGDGNISPEWPWRERIRETELTSLPSHESIYERRPDWQQATSQVLERAALESRADRLMWPSLDATLDYGYSRFPTFQTQYGNSWVGALTLSIPLFQRLTLRSQARAAEFQTEATAHRREETRRRVEQEIRTLPVEFEIARKTAIRRQELLKTSQSLYRDNLRRFKLGRSSTNELTVDLNRYLQTELNAIEGWVEAHLAFTRLTHALGRSVLEIEKP